MATLGDLQADLPGWPDDVLDQWLLGLANQPGMDWPPPDTLQGHRWEYIIVRPVSWWKKVTWQLEERDCSFERLSVDARRLVNSMYRALIEGEDNGYGGDNSQQRFQHAARIIAQTGRFQRSLVTMPIPSGLSVLDGNHRIFAFNYLRTRSDEELAENGIERPAAVQSIWVGTHEDGETPDG